MAAYTTINKPSLYFNTKLYTGNAGSQAITGVGFQPDFTWIKHRTDVSNHRLFDAVRGANKNIKSNDSQAEITASDQLMSFDSDGFTLGADGSVNASGNVCSWNWKANGAGSANTDGSINTTATSVNTTAGFSISKYTATGSNATIGHGLGVAPKMVMVKELSNGRDWAVYHIAAGAGRYFNLNANGGETNSSTHWQSTSPTTSVFSIGTSNQVNNSGAAYIAYCFSEVRGFSKIGYYKGNANADGPFIYTGFKPGLIIIKSLSTNHWMMRDSKRPGYNVNQYKLFSDRNVAENTDTSNKMDFLSNGFKCRETNTEQNGTNTHYAYYAVAEQALVDSTGKIPGTAV
jgi:hypothetical protein